MGGGLTLQCEAKCWFPEPLITFLDNQGSEISAEDPRRSEESPGCLTITRRVTLQTATKRFHIILIFKVSDLSSGFMWFIYLSWVGLCC